MDTGQGQTDGAMTGQVLGERYQLLSVLGSGGMGTVYKAMHLGLGRTVAVKLLHPHIVGDERSVQRFNQEMQVMSALNHPHLIAITDAGITKERAPYFVMEYLEGHSLSDELDRSGNLPEAAAFKIALQIADALDYAHNKGIVHRDLKPNNIMLVGRNDFVKVVDLGIAKLASGSDSLQRLTHTGEIFGSPLYMSPEQCLGKNVDYRADIYGLGCLIYEMVSNNLPITGETPIETLMHHINDSPRPLSQVPGMKMTPGLVGLEQIVMHCLEKDPARRFQSMGELHRALEQVQHGSSTGGYIAPMNEQRDTRISQGQIVPPVGGEYAPRVSEPADSNYNFRQAATVDLSNQQQSSSQTFSHGQTTEQDLSRQRQPGTKSPGDDWRRTGGGGTGGFGASGTMGDIGSYRAGADDGRTTSGIAGAGASTARGPFEKYMPLIIICAAAVIGIIGVVAAVTLLKQHAHKESQIVIRKVERDIREEEQEGSTELPVVGSGNEGSEAVELSSGDTPVQVFMVAEYNGIHSEDFGNNENEYGRTTVLVKYDKKPIILFLSGYLPVHWTVKRESSKVNIQKICVNGYRAPKVDAPPGVPVEKSWYPNRDENDEKTKEAHENPFPYWTFFDFQDVKDKAGWKEVAASVKQATNGLEVYRYWGKRVGSKFVLNNDD